LFVAQPHYKNRNNSLGQRCISEGFEKVRVNAYKNQPKQLHDNCLRSNGGFGAKLMKNIKKNPVEIVFKAF